MAANPPPEEPWAQNEKSGTIYTAVAHIFCAVVGAGVLSLPNAVAWLGWIAGPLLLAAFFVVSLWTSRLLASVYRVGDTEFARYHHAVLGILGKKWATMTATMQCIVLVLTTLAYFITGSIAMSTVATKVGSGFCAQWQMTIIVGAIELVLSQLPNMEALWWVSAIGSISSLTYCGIALVLGCAYANNGLGSVGGRSASPASKVFNILNSLGSMAFAYSFSPVLLEIQDTLRQPPPPGRTMRQACNVAVTGAFALYILVATTGYAALGDGTPGEVLNGFPDAPKWSIVLANLAIATHMLTAIQLFAQPVYETVESRIKVWRIKRQLAAGAPPSAAPAKLDAGDATLAVTGGDVQLAVASGNATSEFKLSPFASTNARTTAALAAAESGDAISSGGNGLGPLPSGSAFGSGHVGLSTTFSTELGHRAMSVRPSADGSHVANSCPIPTLMPPAGSWKPEDHLQQCRNRIDGAHKEGPLVRISAIGSRLGSQAMYDLDTGFANEEVALNSSGFYAPLYQRLVIRSSYIALLTVWAIVMPFFSPVIGLVGALTFWPLCVMIPILMYAKVYKVTGRYLTLMKSVNVIMFVVTVAAAVGAVRSLYESWSSGFTLFAGCEYS